MKTKRIIGMLAAVLAFAVLMVAAAVPAFADPLQPVEGNLVIHKYVNDGKDYGPNNGTLLTGSDVPKSEAINGVIFNIYKIDGVPASGPGVVYKFDETASKLTVYADVNATTPVGTYDVTLATSVTTADDGSADSGLLDQGYYLVVEDVLGSEPVDAVSGKDITISAASDPFVVAVPMTNPAGDDWLTTVNVYPKNPTMGIEKTVNVKAGNAVAVGDIISYTIASDIPADIASGKKYAITDELDPALTPDTGSVAVTLLPGNTALEVDTDYTVDLVGQTLIVSLTDAGRTKAAGSEKLQVTFDVTVNDKILDNNHTSNTVANEASVSFTNKDGGDFDAGTNGDGPKIHTAAIQITKVDASTGEPLDGAKFSIATSEQNAKDGKFLRVGAGSQLLDVDDPGYDAATTDYVISPKNTANFTGLRDMKDDQLQSYWIVEVAAPASYNILTTPLQVTFDGNEANHTLVAPTIANSKGFVLPITGGTGTMLFTVVGIVLLGLAVMVIVVKKRKTHVNS